MRNWYMSASLLILFLLYTVGFSQNKNSAVISVSSSSNMTFGNGDYITLSGQNFEKNDSITQILLSLFDENKQWVTAVPVDANLLQVNSEGKLSGQIKIDGIPKEAVTARILIFSEQSNVTTNFVITVSGNSRYSTEYNSESLKAGSFTITDATGGNNDGIADLNEQINFNGSGFSVTATSLLAAWQVEYTDLSGTVGESATTLSGGAGSLSISSGNLSGFVNLNSSFSGTTMSIRGRTITNEYELATSTNVYPTPDVTAPTLVSATATSLTNVSLVFDEAVSEIGNSAGRFSGSVATISSISGSGKHWTLTVSGLSLSASLGTLTYTQSVPANSNELQDASGNELAAFSGTAIGDSIPPNTPTLDAPTASTIITGAVSFSATADNNTTDISMTQVEFQGSNDGSTWTTEATDNTPTSTTYTGSFTPGTKYSFYRALAVDASGNQTPSTATADLTDAYRIQITTAPTSQDAGTRGQFTITIQNNYTDAATLGFTSTYNLTTTNTSTGTFYSAATGGTVITSINISSGTSSANFWYADVQANSSPTVTVTEAGGNLGEGTDLAVVTINASSATQFKVTTGGSGTETAGTAFDVTVTALKVDGVTTAADYVGDHSLTWSTSATASPDGTTPVVPSNGTQSFTNGVLTLTGGATFFNSAEIPTLTVTDGSINTTTGEGFTGITVNDGAFAEVRIKSTDELNDGEYDLNRITTLTIQGPTQAIPDVTQNVSAVAYDAYGNLVTDEAGFWNKSSGFGGSFDNSSAVTTFFTFDGSGATGGTTYSGTLNFLAFTNSTNYSTGTITVDDNDPATVTGFGVSTDPDDNTFVFASWTGTSSGDDDNTGTPTSYEIKFQDATSGALDTEGEWASATSVGTSGKPSFSAGIWHIDMSGQPEGNKFFAIRAIDDVGNISPLGSGSFTTTSDYSLPVSLTTFEANADFNKVSLNWVTESEIDNQGFNIYRADKTDPGNMVQVNTELIPGKLNTSEVSNYSWDDNSVTAGATYTYYLESVAVNGERERFDSYAVEVFVPVPSQYALMNAYPNPFNPTTNLRFQLPDDSQVSIRVYDLKGNLIKTLLNKQPYSAGEYSVRWDATDNSGSRVASGMYLYQFSAGRFHKTGKMLFLK